MILSDKSIKNKLKTKEIVIEPFNEDFLQPSSYDLHLGNEFMVFNTEKHSIIDVKEPVDDLMKKIILEQNGDITLEPGGFLLAHVKEIIGVDDKHVGVLEGKSSLARLGLIIHATAGFLDPGNCLRMTLEMVNLSPLPIKLYVGMKIAQMAFEEVDQKVSRPYGHKSLGSKYYKDSSVTQSMYYQNFNKDITKPKI
ncbi:MAG: Deoxycytidine triphosphate deaminase [candidate division WS6 bacterium GW2011_GWF2_39_15]|uniref:dCTP deaminase, dUMP-forming n=1 Tax=candidate division WS6 bacterium GW2011_GWF2_39_15 TaxID=1619100 RepID=A0A0G0MN82_9BACT|nr:MAG: Deoxycytidine triphosphate deaminase [candidate division WS6 bacterium GW2011_GWF2_39_15]